jgi:hypothetical protein
MSYEKRLDNLAPLGTGAVQSLTSNAVHSFSYYVERQSAFERILALVTTSVVSSGPVVLQTSVIRADGSGTILLPTLIIPAGTAAGKVVYKNVPVPSVASAFTGPGGAQVGNFGSNPPSGEFLVYVGDQITFAVTTAAAGSGAAGAVFHMLDMSDSPEAPAVRSNMIASA